MKNLIELLSDSGVTFSTQNVVRLVKELSEEKQTSAIEILLGKEPYKPLAPYIEMPGKKCKFTRHNLLRNSIEYSYEEKRFVKIHVPLHFNRESKEAKEMAAFKTKEEVKEYAERLLNAEQDTESTKELCFYFGDWSREYNTDTRMKTWKKWEEEYVKNVYSEEDIFDDC